MRRADGDERWRAPRRWRLAAGALIACALVLAGAVTVAGAVRSRRRDATDPAILALEPGGSAAHHSGIRDARADARRRAACARDAYRRAHRARCPASATARALEAAQPSSTGSWGPDFVVPSWPIHEIMLPTGRVLWLTPPEGPSGGGRAFVFDPATQATREVDPPAVRYLDGSMKSANLFCSGHAALADGRVLVAGGNLEYPEPGGGPDSDYKGGRWIFTFDPWTETWTRQPDMNHGRWYPTVTTLPDGTALITGGTDESGGDVNDTDVELFRPSPAVGGQGTVSVVAHRAWSLYPHAFVVPDSTAAGAAPGTQVLLIGNGPDTTSILDTADWTWHDLRDYPDERVWGSAVLMPATDGTPRKVMLVGGSDLNQTPSAQRGTFVLDLDHPDAGWTAGPALATGRSHLEVPILPDDSLLAVGGGAGIGGGSLYAGPVYASERLDPASGAWTAADVQDDERTYHSTALLLPDGRVLSAGDDRASHHPDDARRADVYTPPYLTTGPRPSIAGAPAAVPYAAPFHVATPDAAAVDHAVLIRPGSTTHAQDMDQRSLRLATTRDAGGLTLTAPADASDAPPGYYMLFLVDAAGRPSEARWVRLDPAAPPDAPPVAAPAVTPPAGSPPPPPMLSSVPRPASPIVAVAARRHGRRIGLRLRVRVPGGARAVVRLRPSGARAVVRPLRRARRARTALVTAGLRTSRRWRRIAVPVSVTVLRGRARTVARAVIVLIPRGRGVRVSAR
jgi:hypothetical protein